MTQVVKWCIVVNPDGSAYKGSTASQVRVAEDANVDDLRDAVQLKYDKPGYLKDIPGGALLVYSSLQALKDNESHLEEDALVGDRGKSKKDALVVVVPGQTVAELSDEAIVPLKQPHPSRKRRWDELNRILAANKKINRSRDTTAYSNVSWNDVKSVFQLVPYSQSVKSVPSNDLDLLMTYMKFAKVCFGPVSTGKEAQRLHFIAPVIVCVCQLFGGEVVIEVEEDLNGNFVKAHGHFEFVLRRGNKRVCIIEAKKDDIEQGMAQDLVGCEVAADIGQQSLVYGVVTNYIAWNFFRNSDDKIEMEECSLDLLDGLPTKLSLTKIAGKLYSLLSD